MASAAIATFAEHARAMSEQDFSRSALSHVDALHRLARYLTGSDARAEDLVQETYARAFAGRASFDPTRNMRGWLLRILRNAFIDAYRKTKREGGAATDLDVDELADEADEKKEPLRGDVEIDQLRGLVATDIEAALMSLSPDARTLILLDLDGVNEGELAEILGCARGTVKSRLSRAREILRSRLADYARKEITR